MKNACESCRQEGLFNEFYCNRCYGALYGIIENKSRMCVSLNKEIDRLNLRINYLLKELENARQSTLL